MSRKRTRSDPQQPPHGEASSQPLSVEYAAKLWHGIERVADREGLDRRAIAAEAHISRTTLFRLRDVMMRKPGTVPPSSKQTEKLREFLAHHGETDLPPTRTSVAVESTAQYQLFEIGTTVARSREARQAPPVTDPAVVERLARVIEDLLDVAAMTPDNLRAIEEAARQLADAARSVVAARKVLGSGAF